MMMLSAQALAPLIATLAGLNSLGTPSLQGRQTCPASEQVIIQKYSGDPTPEQINEAVNRLNQYRKAMGLSELVLDPELSKMAQAHADFYKYHCSKDVSFSVVHFEQKDLELYSKEGDEAAQTSGLAVASTSPIHALEMLMSIPFHRLQFMNPYLKRVGVGYNGENTTCSLGLFVTRPEKSAPGVNPYRSSYLPQNSQAPGGSSALVFPPDQSSDIPLDFNRTGENPDPRPKNHQEITGYPISVQLLGKEAQKFKRVEEATITDANQTQVKAWVSDPLHPAIEQAPNIYVEKDKEPAKNMFMSNADSIFMLPTAPLRPQTEYSVRIVYELNDGTKRVLEWKFKTRAQK